MNKQLVTDFLHRKLDYDDETFLMKELANKPMSEGQIKDMLTRGLTPDVASQNLKKFAPLLNDFREKGLIVADAPLSFKEFKEANPGVICMRKSTLHQMEMLEYSRFSKAVEPNMNQHRIQWKIYMDMPVMIDGQQDESHIHHYKLGNQVSGYGWRIKTLSLDHKPTKEDKRKFLQAQKLYNDARSEISAIFDELGIDIIPLTSRGSGR